MKHTYSGLLALECPDCETHLVNLAPHGERYHCPDCDLELYREVDHFAKVRMGESVGLISVNEVKLQVIWRAHALAYAG
ncbi:MAG: hypothetical protein VKP62_16220 [Candidatus Sericytochromatia bacterium]|nr:hypothetical protein [Candidatus Sericytochromatia bacterium]